MPGGEIVPYNYPPPRRQDGQPFASVPGPGPWPYTGHFEIPPPTEPPYTPGQQHPSPGGGFPQGAMYYSAGQYGTSYTPASQPQPSPYSQRPHLPSMPTEQRPPVYTPPYQPLAPQQFSPRFADGRTGTRRPSIRARKSSIRLSSPLAFLLLGLLSFALLLAIALLPALLISLSAPLGALVLIQEKLKVQKLQRQLQLERSKVPSPGASKSIAQDLIYCLHDQREQENQRRWPDDRSPPGPPSEWKEEEDGATSPHSRFADAPGNINDPYRRPFVAPLSFRGHSGDGAMHPETREATNSPSGQHQGPEEKVGEWLIYCGGLWLRGCLEEVGAGWPGMS
jgi:hypothetical protein